MKKPFSLILLSSFTAVIVASVANAEDLSRGYLRENPYRECVDPAYQRLKAAAQQALARQAQAGCAEPAGLPSLNFGDAASSGASHAGEHPVESTAITLLRKARREISQCDQGVQKAHADALAASWDVYDLKPTEGFTKIREWEDPESGFRAYLLEPKETSPGTRPRRILAIAGTRAGAATKLADANFGTEGFIRNYLAVREALRQSLTQGYDVTLTGHSLGGIWAQSIGFMADQQLNAEGRIHVVTWNSPGGWDPIRAADRTTAWKGSDGRWVGHTPLPDLRERFKSAPVIRQAVHYRSGADVVSWLSEHGGEIRSFSGCDGTSTVGSSHQLSSLRDCAISYGSAYLAQDGRIPGVDPLTQGLILAAPDRASLPPEGTDELSKVAVGLGSAYSQVYGWAARFNAFIHGNGSLPGDPGLPL